MAKRSRFERTRMIVHMVPALCGSVCILIARVPQRTMWMLALCIGGPLMALERLRGTVIWPHVEQRMEMSRTGIRTLGVVSRWLYPALARFVHHVYRPSERYTHSGGEAAFYGMVAAYGSACLLGAPWVAAYGLIFLAVTDPMARVFGTLLPIHRVRQWGNKSVGGFIGGAGAGIAVALVFSTYVNWTTLAPHTSIATIGVGIVCAAFVASVVEIYAGAMDNFAIPVVSTLALWAMIFL